MIVNGSLELVGNMQTNKQLTQQQNLRELARLTFLNLMVANGVMAKTIIRNYKQKQEREHENKGTTIRQA
nr:hypothetical protein [uncultured Mediterranean phage uvMED]